MRVLVKGPISPFSGYGNDTIALTRALINWGANVFLEPTFIQGPVPADVLMLLTKSLEAPFDLAIVHQDPGGIETTKALKTASTITMAWTMWEFSRMFGMEQWGFSEEQSKVVKRLSLSERLDMFDIVVAYDEIARGALEEHTKTPITVVQGGYDPSEWEFMRRDWEAEPFNFFMQGLLNARKSPFTSIEAFKELKDEFPEEFAPANLHLKTVSGEGLHPKMQEWCPGLFLYNGIWPLSELKTFYSKMHVLLAPSLGEGKNLPALQFLSTGGAVVATAWGGHMGWLSDAYAYPLDFTMQKYNGQDARCALPDKDHLKKLMLHIFRNRGEAKGKGELASRTIPHMCSWDSVLERLFERLAAEHPKGQQVKSAAIMCRRESSLNGG